jgi:coenzyme F420-reducing hydrogenase delta subunit
MSESDLQEGIVISKEGFPIFCVENPQIRWMRVEDILFEDCPTLFKVTKEINLFLINTEIDAGLSLLDIGNDPYLSIDWIIARLNSYFYSLKETCKQIIYCVERVILFSKWSSFPATSGEGAFHIHHYVFDFFARVKAATDLIALMVNHAFELGLRFEDCSLERGKVSNTLRSKHEEAEIQDLAADLDRVRNEWVSSLYDMRNLLIHRGALYFASSIITGSHKYSISGGSEEQRILQQYLNQIGITDPIHDIDLTLLCKSQWQRLAELIENVVKKSHKSINAFLISKRTEISE